MTPIEFWFDFSSPCAHCGALQIDEVAARHDRDVAWRPFLLGTALAATGMQPLTATSLRGDHARRDWARLARWLSVPFRLPDTHPFASMTPARAFHAIEKSDADTATRFARHVIALAYGVGRDTTDRALVIDIATGVEVDTTALDTALDAPALRQESRARTDQAIARGIFGSPHFIVDGEPFWDADRLPLSTNGSRAAAGDRPSAGGIVTEPARQQTARTRAIALCAPVARPHSSRPSRSFFLPPPRRDVVVDRPSIPRPKDRP